MDKNAAVSLDALDKKIESLQAKREAVLKKERERKARAQEKWKGLFLKEVIKVITAIYGGEYEEIMQPEECAMNLAELLKAQQAHTETEHKGQQDAGAAPPLPAAAVNTTGKEETDDE